MRFVIVFKALTTLELVVSNKIWPSSPSAGHPKSRVPSTTTAPRRYDWLTSWAPAAASSRCYGSNVEGIYSLYKCLNNDILNIQNLCHNHKIYLYKYTHTYIYIFIYIHLVNIFFAICWQPLLVGNHVGGEHEEPMEKQDPPGTRSNVVTSGSGKTRLEMSSQPNVL